MKEITVPALPESGVEHDFRQTPTRISARRIGASWVVYERRDILGMGVDSFLAFRGDWSDAYVFGQRLVKMLDGRTVCEAEKDGDIGG